MNLKQLREKKTQVSSTIWGGMTYPDLKRELLKLYDEIEWFFLHVKDEYLNRSENSVLKSLKLDKPPRDFLEVLLEEEETHKKRKKIIKFIEDDIKRHIS